MGYMKNLISDTAIPVEKRFTMQAFDISILSVHGKMWEDILVKIKEIWDEFKPNAGSLSLPK